MEKVKYPETSPVLAFFMSMILPSLGQFYNKQYVKGMIALIAFSVGILSFDYSRYVLYAIWAFIVGDAVGTALYYRKQKKKSLDVFML